MKPELIRISYCCSYLIKGEQGYMLVDTGNDSKARIILKFLKKRGIELSELKFIMLSHVHFDHVYGAAHLQKISQAKVIIHKSEARMLEEGITAIPKGTIRITKAITWLGTKILPQIMRFKPLTADIIVEDSLDLRSHGFPYYIKHTPGHTEGCISLISEEGYAMVGDLVFGVPGRHFPALANDVKRLEKSWQEMFDLGIDTVHCGHGKPVRTQKMKEVLAKRMLKQQN